MSENSATKGLIDALTRRVTDLEQELAALKQQVVAGPVKDWRSTVGMFTGDEVMQAIFEEGRKIRDADREKARQQVARGRSRKARRAKA